MFVAILPIELVYIQKRGLTRIIDSPSLVKDLVNADEVFVWNSVTRSADPTVQTPYGKDHFQTKAIDGLQFGAIIRPPASGAHVDQDAANSKRMCVAALGDEGVFNSYRRVQQLNLWRPLRGPVTSRPLAVCDGASVPDRCKAIHYGLFGTRVTLCYDGKPNLQHTSPPLKQDVMCSIVQLHDAVGAAWMLMRVVIP